MIYSKEIKNYDLGGDFSLERADNPEYAKYYAVYTPDVCLHMSYETNLKALEPEDPCFWVKKGEKRIAGVFLEPNMISELFLIPPYSDIEHIVNRLTRFVLKISDRSKVIENYLVLPEQVESFEKSGFRIKLRGRFMMSPLMREDYSFDSTFKISQPTVEDSDEITQLFFRAYKDRPGDPLKLEDSKEYTKYYFDHNSHVDILKESSTLVYHGEDLVGACLVSDFKGLPLIYDIGVRSDYQGHGLGAAMIKRARDILSKEYSRIRLHVDSGNSAESLYFKLGFYPGIKQAIMVIPPERQI